MHLIIYEIRSIALSKPFHSFSNNINTLNKDLAKHNEIVEKLNKNNQDFFSSGNKISELSTSFQTLIATFKAFEIAINGWYIALTGGLALITTFAPELIKIAAGFFKGKDAVSQMVTNLKNLNEVMKASNSDIAAESQRLSILYRSATDVTNAYGDRIKSARQLSRTSRPVKSHKRREYY